MRLDIFDSIAEFQPKNSVPLVFVHGAWLSKWCWLDNFIPYFTSLGYRCIALDLRGHGASEGKDQLNKSRINDYVQDVQSTCEGLGEKFVLVGHSMGGAVVERYIQQQPVAGAVLISSVPARGGAAFVNRLQKMIGYQKALKLLLTKNMLIAVSDPKITRTVFFTQEMPEEDFRKHFARLGNESYAASMEVKKEIVTGEPNPKKVPILMIGAREDGCFLPGEIESNAELYGVKPVFVEGGHLVMVDRSWKEAAENISSWLNTQNFK
jgi:pimeloyl-ACP methyl ester carboxylesterase